MAQQPTRQVISQMTVTLEEQFAPGSNKGPSISPFNTPQSPPRAICARPTTPTGGQQSPNMITFSPSQASDTSDDDLSREVAKIISDFQASCDQVMRNLSQYAGQGNSRGGSPQTDAPERGGEGLSPRSRAASGPSNSNSNMVRTMLEDIRNLVQWATGDFLKNRFSQLNSLQQKITRNLKWVDDASQQISELEQDIDQGLRFAPKFIEHWSGMADYFTNVYEAMFDDNCPVPNLDAIEHPSMEVTQDALGEIVREMVQMCQVAERGERLMELLYSQLDETKTEIQEHMEKNMSVFTGNQEIRENLNRQSQNLLRQLKQFQRQVDAFIEAWATGGPELDEPRCASSIPPSPDIFGSPGACFEPISPTPMTSPKSPRTPRSGLSSRSTRSTPTPELEARIRSLQGRSEFLEGVVERFNDMYNAILQEVQNTRDQHDLMTKSGVAMESIPKSNPKSSPQ